MLTPSDLSAAIATVSPIQIAGKVLSVSGPVVRAALAGAAIGDFARIQSRQPQSHLAGPTDATRSGLICQVVGFSDSAALLCPLGSTRGIVSGSRVTLERNSLEIVLGKHLCGTVLDSMGRIIGRRQVKLSSEMPHSMPKVRSSFFSSAPAALSRLPITDQFVTGVRAIDALVTVGKGQRLCVFAEPGVGKSTLLGAIARHSVVDINVFGLIGERGREVNELIEHTLDSETRQKSIVVVSTSDEPAVSRANAANLATRIAEYFRDQGLHVLLQIDSLTRLFRALREVGLAAGEMPVRRGYPPSVFASLPGLLERAGTSERGSITALYTALLSGDADEDPMVDEVKSLCDGHLILSNDLAQRAQYPAIDVLASVSRLQMRVLPAQLQSAVRTIRYAMSRLKADRDLILLGGTPDTDLQHFLRCEPSILQFLEQDLHHASTQIETERMLLELAGLIKQGGSST